jgi:zinc protease
LHQIEIGRGSAGGVPVFFADAPPPFVGSVLFRVGRADETAPTSGITHLVEHLALPITGRRALDFNGGVDNIVTQLWASGDADLVRPFLADTAARLRALPLARLETERDTLMAEEAAQGTSATRLAFALRFGPQHHGLTGYDEYGLRAVDADAVTAWANERFVGGNAAVWLAGPLDELALELELPAGPRFEPPEPRQLDGIPWPCFYAEGWFGVVAFSLLARRSSAFSAALAILEHRVQARVRFELGLSYSPEAIFMPLTNDVVHVVMVVDTMAVNSSRVVEETLAVFDTLAEEGPSEEELDDERRFAERSLADPHQIPGHLYYAASQHLLGAEFEQPAALEQVRARLTRDEIAGALRDALDTMLVIAPPETPQPIGPARYPLASTEILPGKVHLPKGLRVRRARVPRLILGSEGVVIRPDPERHVTARFDDCALALRYPDGSRTLLTSDGFFVQIEPTAWRHGREIVRAVDAAIASERVVRMDPELTQRVDEVEEVAQASLKSRWLVSEELELLPERLEEDEAPLAFLSTTKGLRAGLLVATDRRVIFFERIVRETWLEWPYEQIQGIEVKGVFWGTELRLRANGEETTFGEIKRPDAERFAAIARERLRQRQTA